MIETICAYPKEIIMGVAGLIGALGMAGVSIYKKKKADKKFKFDSKQIVDTIWQSAGAGYLAGLSLGCGSGGILIAMITGFGVDKMANKTQILNFVQVIGKVIDKKLKK